MYGRFPMGSLLISVVWMVCVPAQGDAQEAGAAGALEEVVVTARRRTENLQNVPISIEAIGGEQMALRGMENIEDVIAQTPNVFTANFGPAGESNFAIRGIPNVGFFVDGIWQQSSVLLNERSVVELDQVEILRGPQGTLYGRDTTGGAIRLYTSRPNEEFGMRVAATTGSYDRLDLTANVDIPLAENVFSKFTVSRLKRDGFQQSLVVDRAYGEIDDELLRADFLWAPTDRLDFRLTLEDSLQQTTAPSGTILMMDPGPPGPDPGPGQAIPPRQYYEILGFQFDNLSHASGWPGGQVGERENKVDFNEGHGIWVDTQAWTLNVEYDISDTVSFTSLTGWREQRSSRFSDFDSSEFQFFSQQQMARDDWITQEFQLSGGQGRIDWVAGIFAWETNDQARVFRWGMTDITPDQRTQILNSPECQSRLSLPPPLRCRVPGTPNTDQFTGGSEEGWAVFGEVTFDLNETLSLTVGARQHDQDNTTWTEAFSASTAPKPTVPGRMLPGDPFASGGQLRPDSVGFDADTYRFALSNQFTDDLMVYIGYSEGFNSGGVQRSAVLDQNGNQVLLDFPFDPEKIENLEVGVRSDLLEGRLRFNATVFQTDWVDLQTRIQITNPFTGELIPTGVNQNVAEAEAKGAEFTLTAQATDRFRYEIGVGLLDTAYTEIDPGVTALQLGDKFGLAPELQYNLGGQWNLPLGTGELTFRVDYNWTDDYIRSYNPDTQIQFNNEGREFDQEAFGLLNARIVYAPEGGQWEVAAFGTNLTDEFYLNAGFNPAILGTDFGGFGRPREAGVTLRLFFE